MKFKPLFALALSLATIGLSLPALAGDDSSGNWDRKDRNSSERHNNDSYSKKSYNYYGNYYPYQLDGYYIYVGSKGDYFDRYGKYHAPDEHPEYSQFFNRQYEYAQYGNYYDKYGKYHESKQASREDRR
jgi:hypothetical protein